MSCSIDRRHRSKIAAALAVAVLALQMCTGADVTVLPALTVVSARAGVHTDAEVVDGLRRDGRVELLSQGYAGSQSDLSIRGSGFSGAGLSVNGLGLRNPQTEHFNAELPLPPYLFQAPEILTGLGQARRATGNLVGTVDYRFREAGAGGFLDLLIGERARDRQSLLYDLPLGTNESSDLSVHLAIFAGREAARGRDYGDNDLDRHYLGGRLQVLSEKSQTDIAVARQEKEFGARGYYGVSPNFYAEERIEDTLALFSTRIDTGHSSEMNINAHWRELEDDYRLYLPSSIYRNEHRSTIAGGNVFGTMGLTEKLALDYLADFADEKIDSTALGDHRRDSTSLSLIPNLRLGRAELAGGARYTNFSDFGSQWLPQAGLELHLADSLLVYMTYTETTRQPSYTELNYESPGSLGNSGLPLQKASSGEIGTRAALAANASVDLAAFSRRSRNTVDWIKTSPADRWLATDLGVVNTLGLEATMRLWSADEKLYCDLHYVYLDKSASLDIYASRYALDYARHRVQLAGGWRISPQLAVQAVQELRWQVENAERTGGAFGARGGLESSWHPARLGSATFAVGVDNLWNSGFESMPGLRAPSRAFHVSARLGF